MQNSPSPFGENNSEPTQPSQASPHTPPAQATPPESAGTLPAVPKQYPQRAHPLGLPTRAVHPPKTESGAPQDSPTTLPTAPLASSGPDTTAPFTTAPSLPAASPVDRPAPRRKADLYRPSEFLGPRKLPQPTRRAQFQPPTAPNPLFIDKPVGSGQQEVMRLLEIYGPMLDTMLVALSAALPGTHARSRTSIRNHIQNLVKRGKIITSDYEVGGGRLRARVRLGSRTAMGPHVDLDDQRPVDLHLLRIDALIQLAEQFADADRDLQLCLRPELRALRPSGRIRGLPRARDYHDGHDAFDDWAPDAWVGPAGQKGQGGRCYEIVNEQEHVDFLERQLPVTVEHDVFDAMTVITHDYTVAESMLKVIERLGIESYCSVLLALPRYLKCE